MANEKQEITKEQLDLLLALKRDDFPTFRDLLATNKAKPNYFYRTKIPDPQSGEPKKCFGTLLEMAARFGSGRKYFEELLNYVEPNINKVYREPIHYASKAGNAEVLALLLADKRTRVGAVDAQERTALHHVCMHVQRGSLDHHKKCLRLLMGRMRAHDINRPDREGFTAVHAAVRRAPEGDGERDARLRSAIESFTKEMLDLGKETLDLDAAVAKGRTARDAIAQRFPQLLACGPRCDARHLALWDALRAGDEATFRALLRETDDDGCPALDPDRRVGPPPLRATCLEMACRLRGAAAFVSALLDAGADPNVPSLHQEQFPVHIVCDKAHPAHLKALLTGSDATDPNASDSRDNTPLHYAVKRWDGPFRADKEECLNLLLTLEHLDLNRRNKQGLTALMVATETRNRNAVESILNKKQSFLDMNAEHKGKPLREVILETFPDFENLTSVQGVNAVEREGDWFDLLHAIRESEFVSKLDREAPSSLSLDNKESTLLQRAARLGLKDAAEALLRKGADVNGTFEGNRSPPGVLAAQHRRYDVLRVFLAHADFDVNGVDAKGNSALHYAVRNSADLEVVVPLLRRGANAELRNHLGKHPFAKQRMEDILDGCVGTNGMNAVDEDYEIVMDYRLLAPGRESCLDFQEASKEYQRVPRDENHISVEEGKETHVLHGEMQLLRFMSQSEELNPLLDHPVVRSFLELKWNRVKAIAYTNFFVYVAFVMFLNIFIINSSFINIGKSNSSAHITNVTSADPAFQNFKTLFGEIVAWTSLVVSLILWFGLCLREAIQFTFNQQQVKGSSEMENYLDWSILFLSIVALFMPLFQPENPALVIINVVTIMLTCAELLVLMSRMSCFAKYVEMLKVVLHSYYLPLVPYCVILVAFGLSFHTLFQQSARRNDQDAADTERSPTYFDSWYFSIIKTLVMMTGELDFDSFPNHSLVSMVLFLLFVLLVTIVLLNLLIGLAVSDTQKIEDMAGQLRLKTRIELILFTENVLVNLHNSEWRILKKLSLLVLRQKLQAAILFPWKKADGRTASVSPHKKVELVLSGEDGAGERYEVKEAVLERATQILAQRSREQAERSAVSLRDVDEKLRRLLQLAGGRAPASWGELQDDAASVQSDASSVREGGCDGDGEGEGRSLAGPPVPRAAPVRARTQSSYDDGSSCSD